MKNYVVGTDKVLAKLDTPCLEGWITVDNIKELQTYSEKEVNREDYPEPVWKGSKFPAALMQQVLGTIHEFPRMETAYSLYYNATTGEWAVKCPDQNGGGASVSYEDDGSDMPAGFSIIGSIHTHPEMSAFWSGTDLNDQKKKHGIHFVFGLHDGLVRYSLVTVFTPTEQFNQDIHNVVEDFDWAQVYPAVPEWVETIKKQAYRRVYAPATTYIPSTGRRNWDGKMSSKDWREYWKSYYSGSTSSYAGYAGYDYSDYDYTGYSGYDCGDSDYDYKPVAGADLTTSIKDAVDKDNPYYKLVDEVISNVAKGEQFRNALLESDGRFNLEHELDLVIIDTSDKNDMVAGVAELAACLPQAEPLTADDKREMLECVLEAMPDVNLIDPHVSMSRNMSNAEAIKDLVSGLVDSYCENANCLDPDIVGELLGVFKDAYETIVKIQSGEYTAPEEEESVEC